MSALTSGPPEASLGYPRISQYGESALLFTFDSIEQVLTAYRSLSTDPPRGVVDVVPGAQTIVVLLDSDEPASRSTVVDAMQIRPAHTASEREIATLVEIPVVYDGEDLQDVAAMLDMTVDELVSRHSAPEYIAAFSGFVPGFAYLVGLDSSLVVPRLQSPRVRVPAGAVAIADQYTAVYPRATPGGWRLIGRTNVTLFDPSRESPAMITAATRVRFRPVKTHD